MLAIIFIFKFILQFSDEALQFYYSEHSKHT